MRRAFAGLLTAGAVAASIGALAASAAAAPPRAERVLELASPLQSEGFNVAGWGWPDGSHSVYKLGLLDSNVRFGMRGADADWSYRVLGQTLTKVNSVLLDAADDFSTQIVAEKQLFLTEGAPEGLYLFNPDGSTTTVAQWVLPDPNDFSAPPRNVAYAGRSADARTLFLRATPGVVPAASPGASASGLYRWHDGAAEPIVLDDGRPPECKGGATVGSPIGGDAYVSLGQRGVSQDGRTIFVTLDSCTDNASVTHPRHVLVWRDGASADLTVPRSGPDLGASYVGNSRDGSVVYVTTASRLTADDGNSVADLYAIDVDSGETTRISRSSSGADDATVDSAIVAPGGTAVWFKTANPLDGEGEPGRGNLFQWSAAGGVRHVLTTATINDLVLSGLSFGSAEVSFDGSTVVISSYSDVLPGASGGLPRLYRLTAGGDNSCISCGDFDANAANRLTQSPASGGGGSWGMPSVSADGATVEFETRSPIDPADRNDRVDAYLWRDGAATLVSTGTEAADSNAAGLSADGTAAYFTSFGALLPGTTDPYSKLYVARIGQPRPPVAPEPCAGDACQGPSVAPVPGPPPLSETFTGAGNVRPAATRGFAPRWPGKAALSAAVRRGTLPLTVTGSGAGRIDATVQARIGGAWVQVAASGKAMAKGRAQLTLKLSAKARKQLAAGRSLRIRVTVRASRVAGARSATFLLRGTRTATAKRVVRR